MMSFRYVLQFLVVRGQRKAGIERGLLTDEDVDTLFSRTPSFIRPVDFE